MEGGQQLPIAQETQAQAPSSGQPIISQRPVGQQQPDYDQVPDGQPATTPDGQPVQYNDVPVMQLGEQGHQEQPEQPVQSGHTGEAAQPQQQPGQGLDLTIDTDFLKSPLCFIKVAEFVVLLFAWATILMYIDVYDSFMKELIFDGNIPYAVMVLPFLDDKADFFKGIMFFCWVMVILYLIIYTFSVPTICSCKRPSMITLTSLIFCFIMFALLLACTGNLVPRAVDIGNILELSPNTSKRTLVTLSVALAFGFLSCILFVVDMVLSYKLFQTQRAQETSPDQGPPQRRALNVNKDYLRSPVFYVKLAEIALLFAAWVCIVKYISDFYVYLEIGITTLSSPVEDSKVDFFQGIAVFSWVMVILLALTFVFSFDKLCSRSYYWTVMSFALNFIMFALLLAGIGNLVPRVVDYGKLLTSSSGSSKKTTRSHLVTLSVALAFGFLSCILLVVDMVLSYKLYQTQRAQETSPEQEPPQRSAWDINKRYLQSPMFYVKLTEIALLFAAWVCIVKYFDMEIFKTQPPAEDSKADFFQGITVFSWVMVILLALAFVFSFDKLCSRSYCWTLITIIIYIILSILLIACCGNLTPRAVDFGRKYKMSFKSFKPNELALIIGLAFGYISSIAFIADIFLLFILCQRQRAEELNNYQSLAHPGQQPVQHPGQQPVQYPGQQSVPHPRQQAVQYPGQLRVMVGVPPLAYSQQPQGQNQI